MLLFKVGGLLALGTFVLAQDTREHAQCTNSTFRWSFNSAGQSPCEMGEALGGVCVPGFIIQALEEDFYYSGMGVLAGTDCVCNTVYYSLLSACAACQGSFAAPWGQWNANCTETYVREYPKDLPRGVPVPHYAYLPLQANGTFNLAAAVVDIGPEATPTTTSSSVTPSPTFPPPTSSIVPSGRPDNSEEEEPARKKSTPIGAIVGGVVGGVLGLGLIGVLIFFLVRKNKQSPRAPSALYQQQQLLVPQTTGKDEAKFYDPNDPTTFPPSSPSPFSPATPSFGPTSHYSTSSVLVPSEAGAAHPVTPMSQHGPFPGMALPGTPTQPNQTYGQMAVPPQAYGQQAYGQAPQGPPAAGGYNPTPPNGYPHQQYIPQL